MTNEMFDAKLRDAYRDLCMMREKVGGAEFKAIGLVYGVSTRTASMRVRNIASEMMRKAMQNTQADPDHPTPARFTVHEFTSDPKGCMVAMMNDEIVRLEELYPALKGKRGDAEGEGRS